MLPHCSQNQLEGAKQEQYGKRPPSLVRQGRRMLIDMGAESNNTKSGFIRHASWKQNHEEVLAAELLLPHVVIKLASHHKHHWSP